MKAIEKIDVLSVKVVHGLCESRRPGLALETVYRWRSALKSGVGISDGNKRLLIEATAASSQPIEWADFLPVEEAAEPAS